MENCRTYKVGLLVERSRAFGRELCEGVITFAQERGDWELHFMDAADVRRSGLHGISGYDWQWLLDFADANIRQ